MLYLLDSFSLYSNPLDFKIIGTVDPKGFRRVLGSKEVGEAIWYKVKIEDKPLFK